MGVNALRWRDMARVRGLRGWCVEVQAHSIALVTWEGYLRQGVTKATSLRKTAQGEDHFFKDLQLN